MAGYSGIVVSEDEKIEKSFVFQTITLSVLTVIGGPVAYLYTKAEDKTLSGYINVFREPLDGERMKLCVMVSLIVGLYAILMSYNKYIREKGSRRGREHGSSKLMSLKDMPKFRRGFFFDPKIISSCGDDYKKDVKSVYFDNIELKKMLKDSRKCEKELKKNPIKPLKSEKERPKYEMSPGHRCFMNSQIMAQDVYVSMNCKFINRNLNTLTIGGSGQGKSFSELFPNVMLANANYVITDPSGEILQKCGKFLRSQGYCIKVFNIKDFDQSMRYNPLMYIEDEKDINILVDALNKNIDGGEKKGGGSNDFFEKAQMSLTAALFSALRELYPNNPEKQTLFNVMELLRMAEQKTDPETGEQYSDLDNFFDVLEQKNPRSYSVRMYRNFQVGGPKVCGSVIISATAVFGRFFDNDAMARLVEADDLDLYDFVTGVDENGNPLKCALFLVIPQDTTTYNFMVSMIYSQLFSIATKGGEKWRLQHNLDNPSLPRHLSFWLDEFANVGKIPSFLEVLSVVRKYEISINIIIQALSQLKTNYKDDWETILGNTDTMIYLGGQEPSTVKQMSEKLGKETIKTHSSSISGGKNGGSVSMQSAGREVMTTSEIEQISRAYELVFITGCKPFKARKYDLTKHPNYNFFGEADPKNNNLNISEFNYVAPYGKSYETFREIPKWVNTGDVDEYNIPIKRLVIEKEPLLDVDDRIRRIDENTIDQEDIMKAVNNVAEKVYSGAKRVRMCKDAWKKARDNKKAMDKLLTDTQSDVKNGKKDDEDLNEARKRFDDACMDEAVKHLNYLNACIDDKRALLEKATDEIDIMKLKDEVEDLQIQIKQAEKVIEDKENGATEETKSVSKNALRDMALTPEQVKELKEGKNQAQDKAIVDEKKKAIKEVSESKEADASEIVKKIMESGVVPASIEGYDPLAPYQIATEDMFRCNMK